MKRDWTTMKLLGVYLFIILILILLSSCNSPIKPDLVVDGNEYVVRENCVSGHNESKYGYHYGYNAMRGKFEYHMGSYTDWVCDSTKLDTIEVNIEKKYYEIGNRRYR